MTRRIIKVEAMIKVEETMKKYKTPKEFLRGGHQREVMVTQWSEKRSIIAYRTYIRIGMINLYK